MPGNLVFPKWEEMPAKTLPRLLDVAEVEERIRRDGISGRRRIVLVRDELGLGIFMYGALLNKVRRDPECVARHVRLVVELNREAEVRAERRRVKVWDTGVRGEGSLGVPEVPGGSQVREALPSPSPGTSNRVTNERTGTWVRLGSFVSRFWRSVFWRRPRSI